MAGALLRCRGGSAPSGFIETGEREEKRAQQEKRRGAMKFHGPNLHRPLEMLTYETLRGPEDYLLAILMRGLHKARLD